MQLTSSTNEDVVDIYITNLILINSLKITNSMLMKTKVLFLLAFVVFCCTSAMAQTLVKGTVVSANDSEPMIGVAILENGTTNGCITDMDGNYSISLQNSNATLTVSFVGYKTQTINVNGRNKIDIRMQEDLKVLDEVVVVGYGVQRKSDLTGAIASVGGDDIKNLATVDAGAVRAEHRIRRVLQVGFRIVSHVLDHLVGIVARLVAGEHAA